MNSVHLCVTSLLLIVIFGGSGGTASSIRGSRKMIKKNGCTVALKKCRKNANCSDALVKINSKCAVKGGSCNAKMWDLPVCFEIRETLANSFFDFENPCFCDKKDNDCSMIYNKIYNNACFGSVKYLKEINQLPKLEQRVEKKTETKKVVKIEKEQILENFMAYDVDDIQHSSFTTALNILTNDFDDEPNAEAVNGIVTVDDVTNTNENDMTPTNGSLHDDSVLLHVVAVATGILIVSMFILGATLLVYFNIKRKEQKAEKNNSLS